MAVQVAVVDPLPLFRDGAVAALAAAGHAVQTPTDVVAWIRQVRGAVVVLTVRAEADWAVLAEAAEIGSTAASLVVLLEEESTAAGVRAVRAGARSVLARQVSAEVLRRTVSAVIDGQTVLPAPVVRRAGRGRRNRCWFSPSVVSGEALLAAGAGGRELPSPGLPIRRGIRNARCSGCCARCTATWASAGGLRH